ncbi:sodium/nucleoside cotransporter 2 [Dermacentor silvarum]|uniref:sodium/nucleoside cotransporter 2 n=1 Tax=Dermacentor silvarum TaxID=543639 RepID=UPI0021008EC0|nr:sodium/nucleoside cotransporter 2 [Dermacentor silvarum]
MHDLKEQPVAATSLDALKPQKSDDHGSMTSPRLRANRVHGELSPQSPTMATQSLADGSRPSQGMAARGRETAAVDEAFPTTASALFAPLLKGARSRVYMAAACAVLYHAYLLFALIRHWYADGGPDFCRLVWILALVTLIVHVVLVGRALAQRIAPRIFTTSVDALHLDKRMPVVRVCILVVGLCLLVYDARDHLTRLASLGGILVLLAINYLLSRDRTNVPWMVLARALTLQYAAAALMLRWQAGRTMVVCLSQHIARFFDHATAGSSFLFGYLAEGTNISLNSGGQVTMLPEGRNNSTTLLPILAFSAMPVIFYVGFCVNALYYWGIMQAIVTSLGGFLNNVVGSTAYESMCAAGNMLFGLVREHCDRNKSSLKNKNYLQHKKRR